MTYTPICVDCGGPRSPSSGQRCIACYHWRAEMRRLVRLAQGMGRHLRIVGKEERARKLERAVARLAKPPKGVT